MIAQSRACNDAAHELGWSGATPFLTMSFLALSVIPHLKITDRGLVDVDRFELVPLEAVKTLYAGGWIVTCDDAGTEHADGWVLVEDGFVAAVGDGRRAGGGRARGRSAAPSSRPASSTRTTTSARP